MVRPLVLLLCLLAMPLGHGQNGAPPETAVLRCLSVPKSPDFIELALKTADGELPIKAPATTLSPAYRTLWQPEWRIGRPQPDHEFIDLARTPALSAKHQLLALVQFGETSEQTYTLHPIDVSPDRFRVGDTLILNTTDKTLFGTLDDQPFTIEPMTDHVLRPPAGQRLVQAKLHHLEDATECPILCQQWLISQRYRTVAIVYRALDSTRLRIHAVHDVFPDPAPMPH